MILIIKYVIVATLVVWLSIKASQYIDMLDRVTKLSGAFLGGVLLSAVTSLPELFTSISATSLIGKPSLCIGNILGSDIFNIMILALLGLIATKSFLKVKVATGNILVTLFVALIYTAILLNWAGILNFEIATLNVITLIVLVLYGLGVRYLAIDETKTTNDDETVTLSVRQIVVRFIAVSIGIVASSIYMTYVTDDLATEFNIGMGLAGAIFLGVATSLPEVSSTIALFRIKNYNVAIGNIVGSNLFNFLVLCIADIISLNENVYDYADGKVVNLLIFGSIATLATLGALRFRSSAVRIIGMVITIACYIAFLTVKLPL